MTANTSEHPPPTHDPVCLGVTLGKPLLQLRFGHASGTAGSKSNEDFYGTPVQWNIPQSIDKVLCAINDWLLAENVRRPELEGMVSTLTMLLFKGNQYYMAHVGDTRVYRSYAIAPMTHSVQ